MKQCRDCKHCVPDYVPDQSFDICNVQPYRALYCDTNRFTLQTCGAFIGVCGPRARFFEPKDTPDNPAQQPSGHMT